MTTSSKLPPDSTFKTQGYTHEIRIYAVKCDSCGVTPVRVTLPIRVKSGNRHSKLNPTPGLHVSDKGYYRISAAPYRDVYLHRAVMTVLCKEYCYYPVDPVTGLPAGLQVHHVNGKRDNDPASLLLVDVAIHTALTTAEKRYYQRWVEAQGDKSDSTVPF